LAREWTSTLLLSAQIHYRRALSPALKKLAISWPEPVPPSLIKRDSEAQGHLQQALKDCEQLVERTDPQDEVPYAVWKLACLASLPGERARAETYARELVSHENFDPLVIFWSLFHGLPIDHRHAQQVLEGRLATDPQDLQVAQGLLALLLARRKFAPAYRILEQIDVGADPLAKEVRDRWKNRLRAASGSAMRGKLGRRNSWMSSRFTPSDRSTSA